MNTPEWQLCLETFAFCFLSGLILSLALKKGDLT